MNKRLIQLVEAALYGIKSPFLPDDYTIINTESAESGDPLTLQIKKRVNDEYDEFVIQIKSKHQSFVRHFNTRNWRNMEHYMWFRFIRYISDALSDLGITDVFLTSSGWQWSSNTLNSFTWRIDSNQRIYNMEEDIDLMQFEEPEEE